jgi:hypothetical protein
MPSAGLRPPAKMAANWHRQAKVGTLLWYVGVYVVLAITVGLTAKSSGKELGGVGILLLPAAALPGLIALHEDLPTGVEIALWVAQFLLSIVGYGVWQGAAETRQQRRNTEANSAAADPRTAAAASPYCLYLRPFRSGNALPTQIRPVEMAPTPEHIDLEQVLRAALAPKHRLIAVGPTRDMSSGAGYATASDTDWKETVTDLAENAKLIVMLPSAQPGTLWELEWVARHRLLERTLLIMPETLEPNGEIESEWNRAVIAARTVGVNLPTYSPAGALLRLSNDGTVVEQLPLALSKRLDRVQYLRRAVQQLSSV